MHSLWKKLGAQAAYERGASYSFHPKRAEPLDLSLCLSWFLQPGPNQLPNAEAHGPNRLAIPFNINKNRHWKSSEPISSITFPEMIMYPVPSLMPFRSAISLKEPKAAMKLRNHRTDPHSPKAWSLYMRTWLPWAGPPVPPETGLVLMVPFGAMHGRWPMRRTDGAWMECVSGVETCKLCR